MHRDVETLASPSPVAVVAALPVELAGARRAIRRRKLLERDGARFWVGIADPPAHPVLPGEPIRGPRTAVAASLGMGRRSVERSLDRLFDEWRPAAVALVGFAGGCRPEARAADLFLCEPQLVEPELGPDGARIEGRSPVAADRAVADAILRAGAAARRDVRVASSVTINVVAASPAAKDSLGRNRGATVCEMENFWVACCCARRGVPFAALRAVFDAACDPLPPLPGPDAGAGALLSHPAAWRGIPRLALRYLRVRRALDPVARALVSELAALP